MTDFWYNVGAVIAGILIGFSLLTVICGMIAMLLEGGRGGNVR